MKKFAYLLILVPLLLAAGCDNVSPKDSSGWIELADYDFPVYVGHFADYVHTDEYGNRLGTVAYGEGGDGKDWQIFPCYPTDLGALPKMAKKAASARDEYHILVQAFCNYNGSMELNAAIQFNGSDTGFFTPHTFSYQGAYDPSLETSFLVSHLDYEFPLEPVVSFSEDTNTYNYVFYGMPIIIPPPWYSFTVTLDELGHVLIRWVIEEETDVLGYQLHRSETNDMDDFQVINAELIPATNTSEPHEYSYTDLSVSPGHEYYYWLEKVNDGFPPELYGPCSVFVPAAENSVSPAYPNPCKNYLNLPVGVKFGNAATVLILDSQHAVRKKFYLERQESYQITMGVADLEPGLYRVFIWFHDGYYAYGDVLVQE